MFAYSTRLTPLVSTSAPRTHAGVDALRASCWRLTQARELPTYFFSFGPSQHSLRLLLETSLGKTLTAVGSTRAGLLRMPFSKPKHQSTTNPGSGRRPGRASQHSLRLLQETSFGQTLAAVGSTRAELLLMPFSKPGAHGLAADLATGGPTGPPGI